MLEIGKKLHFHPDKPVSYVHLNGSLCAFYRFIEHTVKSVTNPYNLGSRSLGVSLGSLWADSVRHGFFHENELRGLRVNMVNLGYRQNGCHFRFSIPIIYQIPNRKIQSIPVTDTEGGGGELLTYPSQSQHFALSAK